MKLADKLAQQFHATEHAWKNSTNSIQCHPPIHPSSTIAFSDAVRLFRTRQPPGRSGVPFHVDGPHVSQPQLEAYKNAMVLLGVQVEDTWGVLDGRKPCHNPSEGGRVPEAGR